MQIDFAKLLGFNSVSDELPDGLDFKDDTIGARLGAKVGIEQTGPQRLSSSRSSPDLKRIAENQTLRKGW